MKFDDMNVKWALPDTVAMKDDGPRLVGGRCTACGLLMFPRMRVCSACMGEEIAATEFKGTGCLHSYSIVHRARKGWQVPYAVGYVDLDEGVRAVGQIELDGEFPPKCDGHVRLDVGLLRVDDAGNKYFSHRFVPED